jgi:demethylmenaquinone methyltransferase / 2-methoxy-6-polyprenyl-1,4-benzoquinol methylase
MSDEQSEPTHDEPEADFGFVRVPWSEKARRVRGVFDSVAPRYDLMNDAMSLGLHRLWKRFTLARAALHEGQSVLDVAAGSGDLSLGLARKVGSRGRVVVSDINERMLQLGRDRLINRGLVDNIAYALCDAERLPFAERSFHCITIGFGLRNVTDQPAALASAFRVLKPGGQMLILEFSRARLGPLNPLYDAYSFQVLPRLGSVLAGDSASYRYLAESIRRHPDQQTLATMMQAAGFERCRYFNLTGGIVAVHEGYRL